MQAQTVYSETSVMVRISSSTICLETTHIHSFYTAIMMNFKLTILLDRKTKTHKLGNNLI